MNDDNNVFKAIGEVWADAGANNQDQEFISAMISYLTKAALWYAVDGFSEHSDDDTEAIEAIIRKKVSDLLLEEVAKVNGT